MHTKLHQHSDSDSLYRISSVSLVLFVWFVQEQLSEWIHYPQVAVKPPRGCRASVGNECNKRVVEAAAEMGWTGIARESFCKGLKINPAARFGSFTWPLLAVTYRNGFNRNENGSLFERLWYSTVANVAVRGAETVSNISPSADASILYVSGVLLFPFTRSGDIHS